MTPRATGGDSDGVTHAEVKNMVADGLKEYDQQVSQPRHQENLDRLDKILDKVTGVEQWKIGWDAVLRDRGNRGDHRRDYLAPILAGIIVAIVSVILTLVFSKPFRSSIRDVLSSTQQTAQQVSGSGKTY